MISDGTDEPACTETVIKNPATSEPPPENTRHQKYRKGNPQEQSVVLKVSLKDQGVVNAPCENKLTQTGKIFNRDEHIRENIGGESTLPTKPK